MTIDSIVNGVVLDHIRAGSAMTLYRLLELDQLDCEVAIIKNATSKAMGKKDIIKIASSVPLKLDVLAYIDPNITVNIIQGGKLVEKRKPELPELLVDVIQCKNPRCITSTEQGIQHVFKLTDRERREYRCLYCESRAPEHGSREAR